MTRLFIALKTLLLLSLSGSATAELRLVSLTPAITETLMAFDLGEQIVGRDQASDGVNAPVVADYRQVNIEAVLALNPTHVIAWQDSLPAHLSQQLAAFDIPVLVSNTRTLQDWLNSSRDLEIALTGVSEHSDSWRVAFQQLRNEYADSPPVNTLWLLWDRPLMVVGGVGYLNEAIQLCGGENPYGDLALIGPTIDPESVIRSNVELIIGNPEWASLFAEYTEIPAIANQQIWQPEGNGLARPGPSLIDGLQQLCQRVDITRKSL